MSLHFKKLMPEQHNMQLLALTFQDTIIFNNTDQYYDYFLICITD